MKLIDADALLEAIEGTDWYSINCVDGFALGAPSEEYAWYRAEDIYRAIENAPRTEIVQCRDCKHFSRGMAVGMCKRVPDHFILPVPYNHFCSYGERRSDA